MSININHGYRAPQMGPDNISAVLTSVQEAVNPVRDYLDARLYARLVAEVIDRRDLHGDPAEPTVKDQAMDRFTEQVADTDPGRVWSHPHSFDLDYGFSPHDGVLYLLVHCQREDYHAAVAAIEGIEHHPYQTSTDRPADLDEAAWAQRRTDWQWLIDAPQISEVMTRWSWRPDPAPDHGFVTADAVIVAHLPSKRERAKAFAAEQALDEHLAAQPDGDQDRFRAFISVLSSPRVDVLTEQIAARLRTITPSDLAT